MRRDARARRAIRGESKVRRRNAMRHDVRRLGAFAPREFFSHRDEQIHSRGAPPVRHPAADGRGITDARHGRTDSPAGRRSPAASHSSGTSRRGGRAEYTRAGLRPQPALERECDDAWKSGQDDEIAAATKSGTPQTRCSRSRAGAIGCASPKIPSRRGRGPAQCTGHVVFARSPAGKNAGYQPSRAFLEAAFRP
jgi:hypothetical protein